MARGNARIEYLGITAKKLLHAKLHEFYAQTEVKKVTKPKAKKKLSKKK